MYAEAEAGVAIREAIQDDLIGFVEGLGIVVRQSIRHPDPITGLERVACRSGSPV